MPYNSLQKVCSPGCAISYTKNKKESDKQLIDGLIKESKERKKIQSHLNIAKTFVHRYIRLRDYGKPCISCGCQYNESFDAGHFYPAGKFTELKFNLDNINCQCQKCNRYNEGEFEKYSLSLPNRIGIKRYNTLVSLAENSVKTIKKWTREELKEIITNVKEQIQKL